MKKKRIFIIILISFLFTAIFLYAQKLPKPVGWVNDFVGVIDEGSKVQMERIIQTLEQKTGAEIAVVTVESFAPYGTIEEYSIELATEWGIGKKGEDNGILILVAMEERRIRLEVGYGLEGIIPDGLAGQIRDQSIVPSLKIGDYGTGLLKGVQAVAGIIAKEYDVDLGSYDLGESRQYIRRSTASAGYLIPLILILLFTGGRFFLWPLLFMGAASSRGFFGGGFGSGGSSFGGGFGGGGFGGGGASGGF